MIGLFTRRRANRRQADEIGSEAVSWIRDAAKRVTGGNCTFADDDLHLLEALAENAVAAGNYGDLPPAIIAKLNRRSADV